MPHTRSARKNLRKGEKHRLHNRAIHHNVKAQVKKFMELAKTGTLEQLRKEYNLAAEGLDKAAAKHVVHRNLASRKKSQLAKVLHAKEAASKSAGAKPAPKK
jgi:small subunit ribosomal protein S20